jgi:hypothetical protein
MSSFGHKPSGSVSQNQKAQLANAYNELGKELSSSKRRVIGNYTLGRVIGEGECSLGGITSRSELRHAIRNIWQSADWDA